MNSLKRPQDLTWSLPTRSCPYWYAIQTRSRQEKAVAKQLQFRGVTTFLPLVTEIHRWSDRRKAVELPLFSSYVFVNLLPTHEARASVLHTEGVVRFVGQSTEGTPIPDEQIEAVRTILAQKVPWVSHPFLEAGQRVRIRGGALDGVEGIFLSRNADDTLVVSIEAMRRSLAIRIKGYDIEVLKDAYPHLNPSATEGRPVVRSVPSIVN